jgi:phage tail-like protein
MDENDIALGLQASPDVDVAIEIEIDVPDLWPSFVSATFAECDGLEKASQVKAGRLTLKHGKTAGLDPRAWFDAVLARPSLRASAAVVMYAADGKAVRARFVLSRCLPVKLAASVLTGKEGHVAVDELQVAYESVRREQLGGSL